MPKTQQAIVPVFNPALIFQPKQGDIFDLVVDGLSTWVGGGGGRGGAKLLDVDELIPTPDGSCLTVALKTAMQSLGKMDCHIA